MIRVILLIILLFAGLLTSNVLLTLFCSVGVLLLYSREIGWLIGSTARVLFDFLGQVLGFLVVCGSTVAILWPAAALMTWRFGLSWQTSYGSIIACIIVVSMVSYIRSHINYGHKIRSLFPLNEMPTIEDIKWIYTDLVKKEREYKRVLIVLLRKDTSALTNRSCTLEFLELLSKTKHQLQYHEWSTELVAQLNTIYVSKNHFDR